MRVRSDSAMPVFYTLSLIFGVLTAGALAPFHINRDRARSQQPHLLCTPVSDSHPAAATIHRASQTSQRPTPLTTERAHTDPPSDARVLLLEEDLVGIPVPTTVIGVSPTGLEVLIDVIANTPLVHGPSPLPCSRAALVRVKLITNNTHDDAVDGLAMSFLDPLGRDRHVLVFLDVPQDVSPAEWFSEPRTPEPMPKDVPIAPGVTVDGLGGVVVIGAIACYNAIQLCVADVNTELQDCLSACETQLDDSEQVNDCRHCCMTKYDQDLLNCYMSCGTNGPDGDYDRCWELRPKKHGHAQDKEALE